MKSHRTHFYIYIEAEDMTPSKEKVEDACALGGRKLSLDGKGRITIIVCHKILELEMRKFFIHINIACRVCK
jgi:hypothetical protein